MTEREDGKMSEGKNGVATNSVASVTWSVSDKMYYWVCAANPDCLHDYEQYKGCYACKIIASATPDQPTTKP